MWEMLCRERDLQRKIGETKNAVITLFIWNFIREQRW
jgi:hypothetical protein